MAIEFVGASDNAGSQVLSVPRPPGVAEGDYLISFKWGGDTPTTPPSGWVTHAIVHDPEVTDFLAVFGKVVGVIGDEPDSYPFTISGLNDALITMMAYRGVDVSSPIAVAAGGYKEIGSSASVTAPSVTVLEANASLIMSAMAFSTRSPSPQGGLAQRWLAQPSYPAWTTVCCDDDDVSAGASGTRTINWSSSTFASAYMTALRPAGDSPPPPTAKPWTRAFIVE